MPTIQEELTKHQKNESVESVDDKESKDRSRNDFNEEEMHTEDTGPVETDPEGARPDTEAEHIPGVAVS